MEFLRFGSSLPGGYWGCCAVDIIQNFNLDPDAPAAIQLVSGDGGGPITQDGEMLFAGPTYRDIFLQRLRFGTFDQRDMPNHAFIAVLADSQVQSAVGNKWLTILHDAGFEFIRSVANSVYTGANLSAYSKAKGSSLNYIFMLVRNIGAGGAGNPYDPPSHWKKMKQSVPEVWSLLGEKADQEALAKSVHERHTEIWNSIGPAKLMKRSEIPPSTPVHLAGQRVVWARQQTEAERERAKKASGLFKDVLPQVSLKAPLPPPPAYLAAPYPPQIPSKMPYEPLSEGFQGMEVGEVGDALPVAEKGLKSGAA